MWLPEYTRRQTRHYRPAGKPPDSLIVWFHSAGQLGVWKSKEHLLFTNNHSKPLWIEHPAGQGVDVVALPTEADDSLAFYPLDLSLADTDMLISPSEDVSIIGFPLGQAVNGNFPIWKTGHVASELDLDYHGKPVFLVDAITKPAMSGSPVIAKRIGMTRKSTGFHFGKGAERFLGVYSGRTTNESDIGMVWRPSLIHDILKTLE